MGGQLAVDSDREYTSDADGAAEVAAVAVESTVVSEAARASESVTVDSIAVEHTIDSAGTFSWLTMTTELRPLQRLRRGRNRCGRYGG